MKKIILSLSAALVAVSMFAGEPGGEALGFARIDYNPASAGMAGAGIASASNVSFAAYNNIAMVPWSGKTMDISAAYNLWAPDMAKGNSISLGGAGRIGNLAIAAAGTFNMYPAVDRNKPSDMMFGAGVSYRIRNILSVGVNAKYANQRLTPDYTIGAFMADVFLAGKWNGVSASVGVANVGGKASLSKDGTPQWARYDIPVSARFGAGYSNVFGKNGIELQADADYYFSGAFAAAVGAQYAFDDMVFVRAGYRYGGKAVVPSYATLGLGFKFWGVKIDAYYMLANQTLRNTFGMSLGYAF